MLLLLITGDDDDNDDDCDEVLSSDYWCHCRWQMPENYPDYGKMMFLAHLSPVLKVSYCDRPLSVIYLCVCPLATFVLNDVSSKTVGQNLK